MSRQGRRQCQPDEHKLGGRGLQRDKDIVPLQAPVSHATLEAFI